MSKSQNVFMAGVIGAVAGAIGGLLFAPRSGKETRRKISRLALELAKNVEVESKETTERVKDIYGKVSEEANRRYEEVRSAVLAKVATVKTAGKEIDKDKYVTLVDEVVTDFKTDLEATKDGATKISKYLKKDWEKVKKALV
jgi:gas vesicle protein